MKIFFVRRKFFSFFVMGAMFMICGLAQAEKVDEIVAIVNEDVITENEVNLFIKMMGPEEQQEFSLVGPQEFKKSLLNRMVEDKLMLQEAESLKLKPDERLIDERVAQIKQKAGSEEAFNQALKAEGITIQELRNKLSNQLLIFMVIEKEVKDKCQVSPKEVTDYYQHNGNLFITPSSVIVDSIFVTNKVKMEAVQKELAGGKPFQDVSAAWSERTNIGEVKRGQLKKELEDFIFNLELNQISKPFSVEDGFYIFKVREKRPASVKSLEEVKDVVKAQVEREKIDNRLKDWLLELKSKAYISIRK